MKWPSRIGGVVVSVRATEPKGRGLNPGRDNGILSAIKIRSTPSFRWEVKPEVPCCNVLRYVKIPRGMSDIDRQKSSLLRPFLLLAPDVSAGRTAIELWWTNQDLSPAGIIIAKLQANC
jgi:hypothetical protein